ncbi:hypothetical protein GCM10010341_66150 [Streptomyces noursei]|nr:hypothetical protein GCM10010341_66150 [Streptomyces noursei]
MDSCMRGSRVCGPRTADLKGDGSERADLEGRGARFGIPPVSRRAGCLCGRRFACWCRTLRAEVAGG